MKPEGKAILIAVGLLCLGGCVTTQPPAECPVHHVPITQVSGYGLSDGVDAAPLLSYMRFKAENRTRYPFPKPWGFATKLSKAFDKKETATYCLKCEHELNEQFEAFMKAREKTAPGRAPANIQIKAERKSS